MYSLQDTDTNNVSLLLILICFKLLSFLCSWGSALMKNICVVRIPLMGIKYLTTNLVCFEISGYPSFGPEFFKYVRDIIC